MTLARRCPQCRGPLELERAGTHDNHAGVPVGFCAPCNLAAPIDDPAPPPPAPQLPERRDLA